MAGISSKAFKPGSAENKKKYNGIEYSSDFDVDVYEADLRYLDPQMGRWWQIDPKIEKMEMWSPYASNYNNPIRYSDPKGDEGEDCCGGFVDLMKGIFSGVADGGKSTLHGAKAQADNTIDAIKHPSVNGLLRLSPIGVLTGGGPDDMINNLKGSYQTGQQLGAELKSGDNKQIGHAVGFVAEKVLEIYVLKKISGSNKTSGLGDLTKSEVKAIQSVVNEAGRPLEVVGSAAKGTRRGVGTDNPVGKGPGTKSDIDYIAPPSSLPSFLDFQGKLPSIDPKTGIVPGVTNPYMGPGIRFEPGAKPTYIPKQ
jgi:RHS repeat-associated protein